MDRKVDDKNKEDDNRWPEKKLIVDHNDVEEILRENEIEYHTLKLSEKNRIRRSCDEFPFPMNIVQRDIENNPFE